MHRPDHGELMDASRPTGPDELAASDNVAGDTPNRKHLHGHYRRRGLDRRYTLVNLMKGYVPKNDTRRDSKSSGRGYAEMSVGIS